MALSKDDLATSPLQFINRIKREMNILLKRGLVLGIISLMLGLTVFAGCSNNTNSSSNPTDEPAASTDPTAEPTPAEPVQIIMERPLYQDSNPDTPANVRIRQKIKEITNIDVVVVGQQNPDDMDEKPNLMLASGEKMDIFQMQPFGPNDWRTQKKNGTIIPLNDLLDKYGKDIMANVNQAALQACTDEEGKIWCLPDEQNTTTTALFIRKDWLEKAGLQPPFTMEEFENMLQVFKDKFNAHGFLPAWGQPTIDFLFSGSFVPTGPQRWLDESDGLLKSWYTHPNYKDFLAKMREWYQKGYIHKEYFTMPYPAQAELYDTGRSGAQIGWTNGVFYEPYVTKMREVEPEGDFMIVAPPKGPAGHMVDQQRPISANVMISAKSENPEAAMKYINWSMGTDEGWLLTRYGEEGHDWTWVDKEKGMLKATDKEVDVDRYGYPVFTSTRLNKFTNKYISGPIEYYGPAILNDPAKYPSKPGIDIYVNYDYSIMESRNNMTILDDLFFQAHAKVIMGKEPLSYWDTFVEEHNKNGGTLLAEEMTKQYNEQMAKMKK